MRRRSRDARPDSPPTDDARNVSEAANDTTPSSRKWTIAIVAVSAVAVALRFADLGGKSLWFDEALSIADSVSLSSRFGSGYHPPLFYYVLHAMIALFGESPSVVRLVAAIPGALTIPALYLAARRMFGERAALVASILLTVSSLHVEYSQEVRMYALATFFLTVATIAASHLFARDGELPARRQWVIAILYTCGAYLAMATHYLAVFVVAAQALALIVCWPRTRAVVIKLAALQAPALVAAGVVVALAGYGRRIGVAAEFFANRGGVNQTIFSDVGQHLLHLPQDLLLAILPGLNLKWLAIASYRLPAFIVFDVIAIVAFVVLARRNDIPYERRVFALVTALVPLPVVSLMLGPEQLRFFLVVAPFLALAIGAGLDGLRPAWAVWTATAVLVVTSGLAVWWYYDPGMDKQPWRRVGEIVSQQSRAGDIVLINEPHLEIAFDRYYTPKTGVDVEGYPEVGGIRVTPENMERWFFPLVRDARRVWFVRMSATASHSDPDALALKWLDANFHRVSRVRELGYNGDIEIVLYER